MLKINLEQELLREREKKCFSYTQPWCCLAMWFQLTHYDLIYHKWILFYKKILFAFKSMHMWMTCYFYLWLIITHLYPLRTPPACKHDQNTYLDLFVSNSPIKHILCMLLSRLGSHEEVAEWKMGCFQALGRKNVNNAQSLEKNSVLPKCF